MLSTNSELKNKFVKIRHSRLDATWQQVLKLIISQIVLLPIGWIWLARLWN